MNEKYTVLLWQDNIWAVYENGQNESYLFKGTLEEVNAWISLKEKGFNL